MTTRQGFAFSFVPRRDAAGRTAQHVLVYCATCTNTLELASSRTNHHHIAKVVRGHQWEFDPHNRRSSRCPTCINLRDHTRPGDSGKKFLPILGKLTAIPAHLIPASVAFIPTKPLHTYTVIVKTRRSPEELRDVFRSKIEIVSINQT